MDKVIIEKIRHSPDPIIRYKTSVGVLGKGSSHPDILQLQEEVRSSPRIQSLLSERDRNGEIPYHPYTKWQGAHWVLTVLADCGYPPGDASLLPLRNQVYTWLFSEEHLNDIVKRTSKHSRIRMHASMEGNALFASLVLGLVDELTERLIERLLWAQWDDGGWNCDRNNKADTSSFYESITPLRALAYYAQLTDDQVVKAAVKRAAEVFLKRKLFRRVSDNSVIRDEFLKLRFPVYHYYNILWSLKIMSEAGFIHDLRCQEALDILQSKQLKDGSFLGEGKYYYRVNQQGQITPHGSLVDWGKASRSKMNEFVTVESLSVLCKAGRISL